MIDILLWLALGAFIGWNFPQPSWAKIAQAKIKSLFTNKDHNVP
jgi:hypothetical protein